MSSTAVTLHGPGAALEGSLSLAAQHQTLSQSLWVRTWVVILQLGCSDQQEFWNPTLGFLAFDTCQLLYPIFLNPLSVAGPFYSSMLLTFCTKLCSPFSCTHWSCTVGGVSSLLSTAGSSDNFCLCFWISAEAGQWKLLLLAGSSWTCCKKMLQTLPSTWHSTLPSPCLWFTSMDALSTCLRVWCLWRLCQRGQGAVSMEQPFDTTHSTFTLCAATDKAGCKRMSKRCDRRRTLVLNDGISQRTSQDG